MRLRGLLSNLRQILEGDGSGDEVAESGAVGGVNFCVRGQV